MKTANINEAKIVLSQLIEAAIAGEEVIITLDGKPLVKLVACPQPTMARQPGLWAGKVWMAEDFDSLPPQVLDAFLRDSE